jgi:hypothetical protein
VVPARVAIAEALAVATRNGPSWYDAELHRLAGELESDPARAEACFAQALAVARRQRAKAWELRAALGLGGLLRRLGRFDEARALVAAVLATFQEGFEAPDLRQARAFLATDRAA